MLMLIRSSQSIAVIIGHAVSGSKNVNQNTSTNAIESVEAIYPQGFRSLLNKIFYKMNRLTPFLVHFNAEIKYSIFNNTLFHIYYFIK